MKKLVKRCYIFGRGFVAIKMLNVTRLNQRKYEDNPDSTFTPLPTNITPLGIELDPETGVDLSNTENKKS